MYAQQEVKQNERDKARLWKLDGCGSEEKIIPTFIRVHTNPKIYFSVCLHLDRLQTSHLIVFFWFRYYYC